MRKEIEIVLHLLFWMATSWFIVSTFGITGKEVQVINDVETVAITYNENISWQLWAAVILSVLMSYATVVTILKFGEVGLKQFLLSFIYPMIGISLYTLIRNSDLIPSTPRIPYTLVTGIFLFYYVTAITYAIARLWKNTDMLRKQMEVEKKEIELSFLRSQLQPHFLFNVLNSLLSMVDQKRNPEMTNAILGLSELLRYVVNETSKGFVPVLGEIQFIKNYVTLQALRYEKNELNFKLLMKGEFTNQICEPGVFIPFIENAIKYGVEPEKESEIEASFDFSAKDKISFRLANTIYPDLNAYEGNGTGILHAKRRLEMAYPQRHILNCGPENGMYIVYLEILTDENNNSRRRA